MVSRKTKSRKSNVKKSRKQKKSAPTTIMGMAYDEFRRYKKKTRIG